MDTRKARKMSGTDLSSILLELNRMPTWKLREMAKELAESGNTVSYEIDPEFGRILLLLSRIVSAMTAESAHDLARAQR
jgi:hypothetical protein